jgi:hypothetical protein
MLCNTLQSNVCMNRERNSELQSAMVNLHPLDVRSDSIMRYSITAVYDPAVVAPAAPLLLGFLAVADFVNVSYHL